MKLRFAFFGFRHSHIFALLQAASKHPQIEVVALGEEDRETRERINREGYYTISWDSYERMLAEVPCDVVAIGDYFSIRGSRAITALQAGKHVIADKPLCTSLGELETIIQLSMEKNLQVGLQLNLRDQPQFRALRKVIRSGVIGEVLTLNLTCQHPLMLNRRAAWYFEPGKHGGTINDIGIHAFDLVAWLTGHRVEQTIAARTWNGKTPEYPEFNDCAQILARLDNNAGLLADFSYTAPDRAGYSEPSYWSLLCHGTLGVAATSLTSNAVRVLTHDDSEPKLYPLLPKGDEAYLDDFLLTLRGESEEGSLTTQEVLLASKEALLAEEAARPF